MKKQEKPPEGICEKCGGWGTLPEDATVECPECKGTGWKPELEAAE